MNSWIISTHLLLMGNIVIANEQPKIKPSTRKKRYGIEHS